MLAKRQARFNARIIRGVMASMGPHPKVERVHIVFDQHKMSDAEFRWFLHQVDDFRPHVAQTGARPRGAFQLHTPFSAWCG